jgi:hypothetical protein
MVCADRQPRRSMAKYGIGPEEIIKEVLPKEVALTPRRQPVR